MFCAKHNTSLVLVLLLVSAVSSESKEAISLPPEGIWKEPQSGLFVGTHPCTNNLNRLCGTIVQIPQGGEEHDVNNPNTELRNRPLLALEILTDFEAVAPNRWQGGGDYGRFSGRIYLPLNGDTLGDHKNRYEIIVGDKQLVIQIAGCRFLNCLSRSRWERVE